jgi:ribonuclease VapC
LTDGVVLDASAILAILRSEKGADLVAAVLPDAMVSTVNLAEVQAKLVSAGMDGKTAWWHITELKCTAVPFDELQAELAGSLVAKTKPFGLSLGDRACLALAIHRKSKAYTTDRTWTKLSLGIEIEVVR